MFEYSDPTYILYYMLLYAIICYILYAHCALILRLDSIDTTQQYIIFVQYNLIFSTATFLNDDNIDGSSVIGYSALV